VLQSNAEHVSLSTNFMVEIEIGIEVEIEIGIRIRIEMEVQVEIEAEISFLCLSVQMRTYDVLVEINMLLYLLWEIELNFCHLFRLEFEK
jgi:hypothetical protein